MEYYNHHYIAIDNQNRITDGWSDGPQYGRDISGAICINEQGGYQFRLVPGGEENPALFDMDGIPLYRWDGQAVQRRTDAEIAADRAAIPAPPTKEELREAQIAAMEAQVTDLQMALCDLYEANMMLMQQMGGNDNG